MKRIFVSLLLFTQLMSVQSGWGSERIIDRENLVRRLGYYQPEKYRAAVKHLQKKYPADYHPGNEWEKTLLKLDNNRQSLITAIETGDRQAIRQAEKILEELDKILLANPLLESKSFPFAANWGRMHVLLWVEH